MLFQAMRGTYMSQVIISILLFSCQEKGINVPGQSTEGDGSSSNSIECPGEWSTDEDGIWYDPATCVAWSPLSPAITWHETVSASEARDGGCDQFCDQDTEQDYCANLDLGRLSWKTPSIDQLKDLTTRQPPFENTDYDLWSKSSDPVDELAWTANIEQSGMEISFYKTSEAYARCIAE